MTEYLMIGEVLKPQGLRGECKIKPCAADLALFERWTTLYRETKDGWTPLPFSLRRIHEGFVYGTLAGCETPQDVEAFRGIKLYIDRAHAAPLEEGAVYIADLIGCRVLDETGRELGVLTDVLQHGSVDTWVFTGHPSFMAPALLDAFPRVDVEEKVIYADGQRLKEVAVFED